MKLHNFVHGYIEFVALYLQCISSGQSFPSFMNNSFGEYVGNRATQLKKKPKTFIVLNKMFLYNNVFQNLTLEYFSDLKNVFLTYFEKY